MIAIRILFQQINKVVAVASIKNLQSRTATPVQLRRALVLASTSIPVSRQASTSIPIPSFAISIIQAQAQNDRNTSRLIKLRSDQARPNVYVGMHYSQTIQELGNASNTNILIREFKYKEIKDQIYNTNYNNPKRNLLLQQSILISTRLLVQNGYPDYPYITKQIQDIQRSCPKLFDIVLLRSEQSSIAIAEIGNLEASTLISLSRYSNVTVSKRLNQDYCRDFFNLPIRISKADVYTKTKISNAYIRDYKNNITLINSRPIKQQIQAVFDDKASQRRIVLSRRDFVRYTDATYPIDDDSNDQIGRIDQMFTYESLPSKLRLFFCIIPTYSVPYLTIYGQSLTDSISEYKIRKIGSTAEQITIGLLAISGKRVYTILYQNYVGQYINRVVSGKVQPSDNVLFVDQDIQFLQKGQREGEREGEGVCIYKYILFLPIALRLLTLQILSLNSVVSRGPIIVSSTVVFSRNGTYRQTKLFQPDLYYIPYLQLFISAT